MKIGDTVQVFDSESIFHLLLGKVTDVPSAENFWNVTIDIMHDNRLYRSINFKMYNVKETGI